MPNEAHIIALAGNPNVGKSTVFNTLTGLRQHTGNWPGKTVAAARGDLTYGGERFTLVDLPGTYSLFPNSAEEEIARDYLCSGKAEAVLILADATCLERSLNLVLQTLEAADVPAVVCVNLLDEAAKKGIVLDLPALCRALVDGMYRTLAWVVSVMLPPMAIFFPLFTLLEDVGYLPRVAFVLDRCFARAGAHGRQSLTMCMGLGCNACGVTGCRIIDSPRERLIAMLTNSLVPCNGRFPLLITLLTAFLSGGAMLGASAGLLAALVLSVCVTLLVSRLLSATLLRGESSAFSLELPPYRRPRVGQVLVRSLLDRTVFVLGRAVTVAAPAGLLIYLLGNCTVGDTTLLAHGAAALDPLGRALGLDGMILLAFLLGFPANEIVLPILLMGYSSAGTLVDGASLAELKTMLLANGWTGTTALCMLLFSLFHFPCGTTTLTLARESKSLKWTLVGVALPTAVGMTVCFAVHLAAMWLKI